MDTFTLSDKEVSDLHNAKCYLRFALESLKEILKDDNGALVHLKTSFKYLDPIAYRLMSERDDIHGKRYDESRILAAKNNFFTIWSMTEVPSLKDSSDIPSGSKITSWYVDNNETVTVEGDTWLDVWRAADKLVQMTKEEHGNHVFVEGFRKVTDGVYQVQLGS